ncbi:MAG: hypothetical protein ACRC46_02405 [Thermoguttaceae bacterium]
MKRVVADYVKLRRQKLAAPFEKYAQHWPGDTETPLALLQREESRLQQEETNVALEETVVEATVVDPASTNNVVQDATIDVPQTSPSSASPNWGAERSMTLQYDATAADDETDCTLAHDATLAQQKPQQQSSKPSPKKISPAHANTSCVTALRSKRIWGAVRAIVCPPHILAPERFIPDELETIALKAMSLDQRDRYADAGEFADAIKRYQQSAAIEESFSELERQLAPEPQ